jgi:hypothetical protein
MSDQTPHVTDGLSIADQLVILGPVDAVTPEQLARIRAFQARHAARTDDAKSERRDDGK